jgi:hypothetical protein
MLAVLGVLAVLSAARLLLTLGLLKDKGGDDKGGDTLNGLRITAVL